MLNIYVESDQSEYWLSKSGINDYTLTRNLQEWVDIKDCTSVAMIELINYDNGVLQQVEFLCANARHVLVRARSRVRLVNARRALDRAARW